VNSDIVRRVVLRLYDDVGQNHTWNMAAAFSYYFVLSLFPALILLSAIVAYLPVPNLFDQALGFMAHLVPSESMGLIRRVLSDVITSNRKFILSFGILGTLWTCSRGFAAAIDALNMAYKVTDDRPFWKTSLLSIGLPVTTGSLALVAVSVMVVGPRFGEWLASKLNISGLFVLLWPYIRWTIAVGFGVVAIEVLYYLAPNVKQRFRDTFPGAVLAVVCWTGLSSLLGAYFRHLAAFSETYGTLGAAITLMVWFYWTGFAMLLGAELNAELAKVTAEGKPLYRFYGQGRAEAHIRGI
jgi:membrane protein